MKLYTPRGMPARFTETMPDNVKRGVIDIFAIVPGAPLDYDVVFRDVYKHEMSGLDFGKSGAKGCHFFLMSHEMREYRARNRRNRVAWHDLPKATQNSIIEYFN